MRDLTCTEKPIVYAQNDVLEMWALHPPNVVIFIVFTSFGDDGATVFLREYTSGFDDRM